MSSIPGKALRRAPDRRPREYPRFRCEFPVGLSLLFNEEQQQLSAHCRDLSSGGIGVLVAAELRPGEVVSLTFSLPGEPHFWMVRAVLRYRRGYHYGFEFLSLTEEQNEILGRFLPRLERSDVAGESSNRSKNKL
ncbi:MAG TPA: PilZ domain-containing protein [Verrucomicrobiae bacterium]|nr:PilZ domain-containing protein [Verrucomicrobiae bacterium]